MALADAHVSAITTLDEPGAAHVFNVGCGRGYSVREVIEMVAEVSGRDIQPRVGAARPGDPAMVVADTARITAALGWRPRHDLREMVRSAWHAQPRQVSAAARG